MAARFTVLPAAVSGMRRDGVFSVGPQGPVGSAGVDEATNAKVATPAIRRRALVKRGIAVGIFGVALVVAAGAGCSSNKSNTGASSGASGSSTAPAGPQVTVDGQQQNVAGQVSCTPSGNNINIGIGDPTSGIGAVVSNDNPPIVHAVGLGSVNGITLGYSDAAPNQSGNAGAAVNGKTYAIKGTAAGVDMSNPQQPQPVTKPFEFAVTCP
jgi:lipoprotein LpqH